MTSTTPALRRTIMMVVAATAIALSTAACSSPSSTTGSSHAGATGSQAALCADAVGDAVTTGSDDSNMTLLVKTWDKMAEDTPADIQSEVVATDQAVQKLAKGDKSKATQSDFTKHFTAVASWVADNCKQ